MRGLLFALLYIVLDIIPMGQAELKPLQQRDSALVADQFSYGVLLDRKDAGTGIGLTDFSKICNDTLVLVRDWQIDTLKDGKLKADIVVAPFEEGEYEMPDIYVLRRNASGSVDTLRFSGPSLSVMTMPVDTATFSIHPLKAQINYPVTFAEILPYIAGGLGGIAVIVLLCVFLPKLFRRKSKEEKVQEPAHIEALRELEKYRSDKYWVPSHQKAFYSGITDILKNYIDRRFGIDAPEMTTIELFEDLKGCEGVTPQMYESLKKLFETADYVKFAKYVADDEENAQALPLSVNFVTSTYQAQIEEEGKNVL